MYERNNFTLTAASMDHNATLREDVLCFRCWWRLSRHAFKPHAPQLATRFSRRAFPASGSLTSLDFDVNNLVKQEAVNEPRAIRI
ncbi:hypothetical protein PAMA_005766 [Pampus argenteus]